MAGLHRRGDTFHVSFRLFGTGYRTSLRTADPGEAERRRGAVEETVDLIRRGRLSLPDDPDREDVVRFVLSDGKLASAPAVAAKPTLAAVLDAYFDAKASGKEPITVRGERMHARHFVRLLGGGTAFAALDDDALRKYAAARLSEPGRRGRTVSTATVGKEFRTFDQVWKLARSRDLVAGDSPSKGVSLRGEDEKEPFRTWDEIEAIVARGGLTDAEVRDLWDGVFLDEGQVLGLVEHVRSRDRHGFVGVGVAVAAFTGGRKAEILRCRVEDFDFDRRIVRLRARKDSRTKRTVLREVPMHDRLAAIMDGWFAAGHPGGRHAVAAPAGMARSRSPRDAAGPVSGDAAHDHFVRALRGSRWDVLKGWHVLRHSFCSNCARRGVPDGVIDAWMGHKGDEAVKKRYRHLFPADGRELIGRLFRADPPAAPVPSAPR